MSPALMVAGLNVLATVGAFVTVSVATAGAALLPLSVTNAPAGMVLVVVPALVPVVLTTMVQVPGTPPDAAGMVAPAA